VRFLLDTDHISILQRQSGKEYAILSSRISQHPRTDFAFSVVSLHEQLLGCNAYLSRARKTADVVRGYSMLGGVAHDFSTNVTLPFDAPAGTVFDSLLAQRTRIGRMDLRIASIALSRGLILLTRNASDFSKVPTLQFQDWTV
jgi:tRNA(fMet)-specific endonuclease VapC